VEHVTPVGAAAISTVVDVALSAPLQLPFVARTVYCQRPTGTALSTQLVVATVPLQAAPIDCTTPASE
jgi:hypothetical protein